MAPILWNWRRRQTSGLENSRDCLLHPAHEASSACPSGDADHDSPEASASILCRILFLWAFPVLWLGFRRGRLNLDDLPPVPPGDRPKSLATRVCDACKVQSPFERGSTTSHTRGWLKWVLLRSTWPVFFQGALCHILQTGMSYSQPILLHRFLVRLTTATTKSSGETFDITLSAVWLALVVMGFWIFAEYGWNLYVRADLRAQTALSHMVYRKSLFLEPAKSTYTIGDLQNHFATDCTKFTGSFFHWSHIALLEAVCTTCVVAWNLTSLIGSAGVIAILTVAVMSPFQFLILRRGKRLIKRIQQCRDKRSRLCHQFLSAMRVVKCFRLEELAVGMVSAAREEELRAQWGRRKLFPISNFIASTTGVFGSVAAFLWLELVLDIPVDPAIAFTVLSWSNMLKNSMMTLPNTVTNLLDAYVCIARVEILLDTDRSDERWLEMPIVQSRRQLTLSDVDFVEGTMNPIEFADDFVLQNCDLGWPDEQGHRGIHDLTLQVNRGELLLICGPIGCGKSVLIEGLAGARLNLSGSCLAGSRSMALVAQRPWLLNETIQDNITFGRALDPELLARTLECCSLCLDLEALPSGLGTLVGAEGVQLSGGQKQRVSLARAIYSEADIILMDDVMSALDAHVGRHVWESAICGALSGRTRILATHQAHYCSHPAVTRVLLLGPDGTTEYLGPFQQLHPLALGSGAQVNYGDAEVTRVVESEDVKRGKSALDIVSIEYRPANMEETRRTGSVLRADLWAYAEACGGMCGVATVVLFIIVYYGIQLTSSLTLATWANANLKSEEAGLPASRDTSKRYLSLYFTMCLLTGGSCFSFFFVLQLVALKGSQKMHQMLLNSLIATDLSFFDQVPIGRILNRCLKDMATIDDNMPAAFRMLFESWMAVFTSSVILALFAWQSLCAIPPFALLYYCIMTIYRWPARDLKRLEGVSRSPAMNHFSDSVRGAGTIKAYKHEARFLEHNLKLLGDTQKTVYWFWTAQGWVSTSQEVLGTMLLAVIAGVVGYRASTGYLSAGLAGMALSYAISMPRDLMWLSRRLANMEVEYVAIERVMEYVRLPSEDESQKTIFESVGMLGEVSQSLQPANAKFAVFAENVRLRYSSDGPWVLHGLSLQINVGEKTAVVGRTGCGKSSLLSAFARLYPLSGGLLLVHGQDVVRTPLAKLRATVSVLLQDPIFFSGTIRSNLLSRPPPATLLPLAPADEVVFDSDDEALWNALRAAGLELRIRALPNGLGAHVQESGQNFSQGERQLLCLARVLVGAGANVARNILGPRILLCDEPTSACDLATDERIHGTLLHGLPPDWTLMVVCHRLHRIREFDSVFVLDGGRVVEYGPPGGLLSDGLGSNATAAGSGLLAVMCSQQGVP